MGRCRPLVALSTLSYPLKFPWQAIFRTQGPPVSGKSGSSFSLPLDGPLTLWPYLLPPPPGAAINVLGDASHGFLVYFRVPYAPASIHYPEENFLW